MDHKKICRTCLHSGGTMSSLFNSTLTTFGSETTIDVRDVLKVFIGIQISYEDGFSNQICTDCLDEIQRSYCFKLKCQRSEAILHQLKDVTIKLKKLKNVYSKLEYDNEGFCKPYKELNLIISQIKNENIEYLEISNECERGGIDWVEPEARVDNRSDNNSRLRDTLPVKCEEFTKDGQLEEDNLLIETLGPMECAYNFTQEADLAIQDIKQEPELQIVMNKEDLNGIDMETNESEDQSNNNFRCPACPWKCLNLEILNKHIIYNHMELKFCKICNEEFECTTIKHCSNHLSAYLATTHTSTTSTHRSDENCKIYKSLLNTNFRSDTKEKSFNYLSKEGRYHSLTRREKSTVKKDVQCWICSKSFKYKSNLQIHMGRHVVDQFKCNICLKSFRYKANLKTHLAVIHANDDAAQNIVKNVKHCEICSKIFPSKSSLITHLRIHTKEKPFKCKICSKAFGYMHSLKGHLRAAHSIFESADDKKDLQCSKCFKIFGRKTSLTRHLRIHTGEEKFKCKICSQTFRYKNNLNTHLAKNHDNEDVT